MILIGPILIIVFFFVSSAFLFILPQSIERAEMRRFCETIGFVFFTVLVLLCTAGVTMPSVLSLQNGSFPEIFSEWTVNFSGFFLFISVLMFIGSVFRK